MYTDNSFCPRRMALKQIAQTFLPIYQLAQIFHTGNTKILHKDASALPPAVAPPPDSLLRSRGMLVSQQMRLNHWQPSGQQAAQPVPPALQTLAAQGLLRVRVKALTQDLVVLSGPGGESDAW